MKRYMICPIMGDGTLGNEFRPAVSNIVGAHHSQVIPVDALGIPLYNFTFCIVGRVEFAPVFAVTNGYVLPDYPLDGRMDGMSPAVRSAMNQSLESYDLDGNGLRLDMSQYSDADSYESVLLYIYQTFDPLLTPDNFRNFDCREGE